MLCKEPRGGTLLGFSFSPKHTCLSGNPVRGILWAPASERGQGWGTMALPLGNCKGLLIGLPAQPLALAVCSQPHGPRDFQKSVCQIMALLCSKSLGESPCPHRGLQPTLPEPMTHPCDSTILCSSHALSQGHCPCCSLCLLPLPESPVAYSLIF